MKAAAVLRNSPRIWETLWEAEKKSAWRADQMDPVYSRIIELTKRAERGLVVDIGGGNGACLDKFTQAGWTDTYVVEHNMPACTQAEEKGHKAIKFDLEENSLDKLELPSVPTVIVCTEVLEHLTETTMHGILAWAKGTGAKCFFSIPNNRLGPDEEPQHARKLTVRQFLGLLREYFPDTRIECFEPWYQMGICNFGEREETVSVCFPARNEELDIERVLKSFRPVADQMVIGIDPRSTDRTKEIAEAYAEVVFDLEDPQGKSVDGCEDEQAVHFSHIRNQCIDKCTCDWIFMTEAHEHLAKGHDTVLAFGDLIPKSAIIGFVFRTSADERWGYPWVIRRSSGIKFTRRVHNTPDYPLNAHVVRLPQIETFHQRHMANALERKAQRKIVNRKTLMEDWTSNKNEQSLFYLCSEWRQHDKRRASERLEELLALPPKNGAMRYQARMNLAEIYYERGEMAKARSVLIRCTEDDWNRTEHWIWLGDMAYDLENYREALQFYRYAAASIGDAPFTMWWIKLSCYTYLPAQRMAMCYAALGDGPNALVWARRVIDTIPEDAPPALVEECHRNEQYLIENVEGVQQPKTEASPVTEEVLE